MSGRMRPLVRHASLRPYGLPRCWTVGSDGKAGCPLVEPGCDSEQKHLIVSGCDSGAGEWPTRPRTKLGSELMGCLGSIGPARQH